MRRDHGGGGASAGAGAAGSNDLGELDELDDWWEHLEPPPDEWASPAPADLGFEGDPAPPRDDAAGHSALPAQSSESGSKTAPEPEPEPEPEHDNRVSITGAELDALFERPARPRVRIGIGAGVVLALVALAVGLVVAALQPSPATTLDDARHDAAHEGTAAAGGDGLPGEPIVPGSTGGVAEQPTPATMFVHVVGAVSSPGVFALAPGSRVIDAVNAAGGFAADADRGAVNLARSVVDGEQLYVPRIGEEPPGPAPGSTGAGDGATGGAGGGAGAGGANQPGGLINLNTASQAELETLPRIGPALAGRILDYREQHGGFAAVDELRNVAGIGDATFEALAPLVTV